MTERHHISLPFLPHRQYHSMTGEQLDSKTSLNTRATSPHEQPKTLKLGSIQQYLKINHQLDSTQLFKKKTTHKKIVLGDPEAAQRILVSRTKNREEKQAASYAIVSDIFQKSFGKQLCQLEFELKEEKRKKASQNRNMLNMNIFEDVVCQMEHNPRSPSILLRKIDLEQERGLGVWEKESKNGRAKKKKTHFKPIKEEERRIEMVYRLKKSYDTLKKLVVPTRSEEYELMFRGAGAGHSRNQRRHLTKKSTMGSEKQNHGHRALHSNQVKRAVELAEERLLLTGLPELRLSTYNYMLSQVDFTRLVTIKIKNCPIPAQIMQLLIDLMIENGPQMQVESVEFSSLTFRDYMPICEKLNTFFRCCQIDSLTLQGLSLTSKELSRIFSRPCDLHLPRKISLMSNKIDVLAIRLLDLMTHKGVECIDMRKNDIPHYTNLKGISESIVFF